MEELRRDPVWEQALTRKGFWVRCFERSQSTMDLARKILAETPGPYGLVLSKQQLHGRGRQGREWAQPKVGFFATYACTTALPVGKLSGLSLLVGCVVSDVLGAFGCETQLKWPNDLLSVDGRKIGGILIELENSPDGGTIALIGIGLNLAGEPLAFLPSATSVQTLTGREHSAIEVAELLSPLMVRSFEEFERTGFAPFRDRWLARSCFIGEQIRFQMGRDAEVEQGYFRGIDEMGRMLVEQAGQVRTLSSGEVLNVRVIKES